MSEISKKQWVEATNNFVVVIMWAPKPKYKRQVPTVRVAGDYPTRAKANAAKKKLEKKSDLDTYYGADRRTVFVAKKFDVSKLDLFDTYVINDEEPDSKKEK